MPLLQTRFFRLFVMRQDLFRLLLPTRGVEMHLKYGIFAFFVLLAAILNAGSSFGETLYSYVDENGVQHFTNIPPVINVKDLKITGSAPVPSAVSAPSSPSENAKPRSAAYDPIIEKYASDYQLDASLIRSIIATESGFNAKAVSPKGARGLMQLMPATAARLGVKNSFDPEENIRGGVRHFRSLMDSFRNNLTLSLAAYNAGENLVQRLGRVPDFKETRDYVESVTRRYGRKEASAEAQGQNYPSTYRFVDDDGVLHLTNIPPLR
jgi:soluble lytic murein transglycosylase-like protein